MGAHPRHRPRARARWVTIRRRASSLREDVEARRLSREGRLHDFGAAPRGGEEEEDGAVGDEGEERT
eukprot:3554733-Pyramimonas_sp.AAC.1